jgi:F-type H+-transporting ATPase subunit a
LELNLILLGLFAVVTGVGFLWRHTASKRCNADPTKLNKRYRTFATALIVLGLYIVITRIITILFAPGEPAEEGFNFEIDLWAKRSDITILGLNISETVLNMWFVMAGLVILALIVRFTLLRQLEDVPRGAQNIFELVIEQILNYMQTTVHGLGEVMGSYVFSVAVMLVGCAVLELFGFRTPASDITFTFALSIITFFLINWYGIKKKGVNGRIKSMAEPRSLAFLMLPINVITNIAIPVSLACRMFGNMLGGLVIMDLLYTALGYNAVGIPGLLGLFFIVFEPVLQGFIFVTLTLTFIREAVE